MGTVRRVGIIGMGHVGAHVANALMLQGVVDELRLCETREGKLEAEVQDLGDSVYFCPHEVRIRPVGDAYEELADCDLIVNATGDIALAAESRDGEPSKVPVPRSPKAPSTS